MENNFINCEDLIKSLKAIKVLNEEDINHVKEVAEYCDKFDVDQYVDKTHIKAIIRDCHQQIQKYSEWGSMAQVECYTNIIFMLESVM